MRVRGAGASILILFSSLWAQSGGHQAVPASRVLPSAASTTAAKAAAVHADSKVGTMQTTAGLREHTQEMQDTLSKMHALLKQMRVKAASNSKDPYLKANLQMWELMLSHLDKQLGELQFATMTREDLEKRRAAMYKQALARASVAGRAAQGMSSSQALQAGKASQIPAGTAGSEKATDVAAKPEAPGHPNQPDVPVAPPPR